MPGRTEIPAAKSVKGRTVPSELQLQPAASSDHAPPAKSAAGSPSLFICASPNDEQAKISPKAHFAPECEGG